MPRMKKLTSFIITLTLIFLFTGPVYTANDRGMTVNEKNITGNIHCSMLRIARLDSPGLLSRVPRDYDQRHRRQKA